LNRRNMFLIMLVLIMTLYGCTSNTQHEDEITDNGRESAESTSDESTGATTVTVESENLDEFNTADVEISQDDDSKEILEYLSSENIDVKVQSNKHSESTLCVKDNWIYTLGWDEYGNPQLIKTRSDLTDWTTLDECFATYITVVDNYIYYMGYNESEHGLYRIRTSGEDKVQISSAYGEMQIVDGYIYYTDLRYQYKDDSSLTSDDAHLYRCDLDGKNVDEIIDKPIFNFYIFENGILYQDDTDNESLHIYYTESGTDVKLNDDKSYWSIFDGEYIYYVKQQGDDVFTRSIWRMKPDGEDDQIIAQYAVSNGILMADEYIYFVYADDSDRLYRIKKDGTGIELITQDTNILFVQMLENGIKYLKYNDDYSYIQAMYLAEFDGSNRIAFQQYELY